MSDRDATQRAGDQEGRIREILRNLKKLKAPGQFEQKLQHRLSRLHDSKREEGTLRWTIPVYVGSGIALFVVGIIGYSLIITGPESGGGPPPPENHTPKSDQRGLVTPARPADKGGQPAGIDSRTGGDREVPVMESEPPEYLKRSPAAGGAPAGFRLEQTRPPIFPIQAAPYQRPASAAAPVVDSAELRWSNEDSTDPDSSVADTLKRDQDPERK